MKRFPRPGFLVLAPLLLAGCTTGLNKPTAYCPLVAVLEQAQTVTTFLPGRSDVAAQVTTARITGVAGSCETKKKNTLLDVRFKAGFAATNGPANNGKPVTLPYFVAIVQGDRIVSKTDYSVTFKFDGNASAAQTVSKPVTVELSNVPASTGVQILVGFQETPAQLNYDLTHPAD